jgi:hypothetical protein
MDEKFLQSQEANELLNNDAFKRAFEGARQRIITVWELELEPAKRESAWYMLQALEQLKVVLVSNASASIQDEAKTKALRPR